MDTLDYKHVIKGYLKKRVKPEGSRYFGTGDGKGGCRTYPQASVVFVGYGKNVDVGNIRYS